MLSSVLRVHSRTVLSTSALVYLFRSDVKYRSIQARARICFKRLGQHKILGLHALKIRAKTRMDLQKETSEDNDALLILTAHSSDRVARHLECDCCHFCDIDYKWGVVELKSSICSLCSFCSSFCSQTEHLIQIYNVRIFIDLRIFSIKRHYF